MDAIEDGVRESVAFVRRTPYLGQVSLLAVVYFAAAKLSLFFAIPPGYATAVWPPSGVALAAALMLGNRIWPGIWIGAALVNFTINSSLFAAVLIGSGNTLEALAGAALIRRYIGVPYRFERGEDVIKFVAFAALSATVAATVATVPLAFRHALSWPEFLANWWTWWQGDATGIIIVTPLILSWSVLDATAWPLHKKAEGACLGALLLVVAWMIFSVGDRYFPAFPRAYWMVPFILWAAFRFSQRETATALAALCAIAIWYTLGGRGPFASGPLNASLLLLLTYIGVLWAMGLVLCAVVGERSRAMEQLRKEHDELEFRVKQRTRELEQANRELLEDITARAKLERELRENREQFQAVAETANEAIVSADERGAIIFFNRAAERMFGHSAQEAAGQPLTLLMPERFHDPHRTGFQRFLATGQSRIIGKTLELTARNKTGEEFPVELSIADWVTAEGKFFTAILRDITERKQADATRARLAAIVESSQDAILSRDLDGRLLSWNAGAERLFGYTAAEVMGRDFRMAPPKRQHEVAELRDLLSQGKSVSNFETVRIAKDGRRVDVWLSMSPIQDSDGNVIGLASILRDITERKQVQQTLQKAHDELELRVTERTAELSRINAELEKFAYVASHDLQEPLRTIINFSDLLERRYDDKLDRDGREFIGFIVSNATRMRRLIDDLLEFSRTGHERLVLQPVDCGALLLRVLGNLGQGIAESGVVVTHDPLPTIAADPGQMEQLFQNLVGNAIKFHGAEKPAAHVGVQSKGADWEFSVRDNGIGIDPRFSERIFEMFQRLHSGGKHAGSGVGLAICKKIVERHGGRIWVESREGQGATFYFTLPREEPGHAG